MYSHDFRELLLTSSHDGSLRLWRLDEDNVLKVKQVLGTAAPGQRDDGDDGGKVLFAKFSPDFNFAVSATSQKTACVHDLVKGTVF